MEFVIMLLETLSKFGSGLSVSALLLILIAIMIYFLKDNLAYRKSTDEKLDAIYKQQDEMQNEYRIGIEKINKDLIRQHQDTQRTLMQLQEQQNENQRLVLRGLVTNESLPDEYRLSSYDKYKELGGNSWLDKYVKEKLVSKTEERE